MKNIGRLIEYTSWSGLWKPVLKYALIFFGAFCFLISIFLCGDGFCVQYPIAVACGSTSEYVNASVNILVRASSSVAQSLTLSSQYSGLVSHQMFHTYSDLYFWVSGMTDGSGNERLVLVSSTQLISYGLVSCVLNSEKSERDEWVQGLVAVVCAVLLWTAIILGMRS